MNLDRLTVMAATALLAFGAGHRAHATLDISDAPLFLVTPVKPALIMALDDSGSMDGEVIFPSNDGAAWWNTDASSYTGFGFDAESSSNVPLPGRINFNWNGGANNDWKKFTYLFPNGVGSAQGRRNYNDGNHSHYAVPPLPRFAWTRSPAYNAQYFDPNLDYPPYPDTDTQTFENIDPTDAPWDPVIGDDDFTVDLTAPIAERDWGWTFRMYDGMVIPEGTRVNPEGGDSCDRFSESDWHTLSSDLLIIDDFPDGDLSDFHCDVAIEYYPATFWLPASIADDFLPDGFGFIDSERLEAESGPVEGETDRQLMYGYEIKPENFISTSAYKEAMQKFANWFSYYRKRTMTLRGAIGRAFEPFDFLRVGNFTINDRDDVDMIDLDDLDDKYDLLDWAYNLRGTGGTPNKQAVQHMGEQFERTSADGGAPILEACQKNFGMLFTDGYANAWTGAGVGNADGGEPAPIGDSHDETMADIAYTFYENNLRPDLEEGRVPTPGVCDDASPPLSADCQDDLHMNFFGVSMGGDGLIYQVDEDATDDPYANPPDWIDPNAMRNPSAIDDMWHATINTRGEMFSARSPEEVARAIESVLSSIAGRTLTVGFSANSTRLDLGSLVFQSTIDSTNWTGDVLAFEPGESAPEWVASEELPAAGDRNIFTWDPETAAGAEFTTGVSDAVKKRIAGLDPADDLDAPTDNSVKALIDYVRGDQTLEQPVGPLRQRDKLIGDIVNSRPVYAGPRNEGWTRVDPDYADYLDDVKQDRQPVLYVGANDGMLHAFNADAESGGGSELFGYVPSSVHGKLRDLASTDYDHEFYVDGQMAIGDAKINGGWTTVLVGTLGAGGRGVYALDIGDPTSFDPDTDVLWEFTHEDDPDMGFTFGEPIISRLEDGTWVAVVGNGYNSEDEQAYLYVIDLESGPDGDGNVLHKVALGDPGDNGLSGVTGWRDVTTRTHLERVYAGDLNGTVWRVDFNSSSPDVVYDDGLFTVPDGNAITATPTLAAHPSGGLTVYFGTGQLIEVDDRSDETLRRFFAVRDRNEAVTDTDDMGEVEITLAPSEDGVPPQRKVTASAGVQPDGWFMELEVGGTTKGERVLSKPRVVFGTLITTSFEPNDDPCLSGGTQRAYVLDALTGDGRLSLTGSSCVGCGGVEVGTGAPIAPPVVIKRPDPPDSDVVVDFPGNPDPSDPEDPPSPPSGGSTETREGWCSEFGIPPLTAGGEFQRLGTICEGRQVWRQIR